ncbi:MAG TPA: PQQ-dependent sugar dehydrogenase, partial [Aggregatilineales bacterium]|nr:PQQ-dependent sugar dehydrogenase [Aggregatilineales bacterium]
MRKRFTLFFLLILLGLFQIPVSSASPDRSAELQRLVESVRVPEGFEITIFADNVPNARGMEWTPNGTLFVGTRAAGAVYALRDDNFDGAADGVVTITSGRSQPVGVAFRDGSLYISETTGILRYDNIEANLANPPEPVLVSTLPDGGHHNWKFIAFGPDNKLYVPIGAPCNDCIPQDARYGTIARMNPDGSEFEIFAQGIRNTVGFDWHPVTGELWFTDNGVDHLGDDIPADELNHAPQIGMDFGFPYCHAGDVSDPDFGSLRSCAEFTPPAAKLGPHIAALGMRFYTGEQFPDEYKNQIFIAEHG